MVFGVSIAGWNLGFTARFWISMTELLNFHDNKKINKNQCVYQWICDIQVIWKLSYRNLLWIIVFELFEHWTMLITFLFLVLILSIWLTISQIILRKISFSNFLKNMTRLHLCGRGPTKTLFICPSFICPPVMYFSQALFSGVSLFFCMRIFCHIY